MRRSIRVGAVVAIMGLFVGCDSRAAAPDNHAPRSTITTASAPPTHYPSAIYPPARSFPDWGYPSGCPSLRNVDRLPHHGQPGALRAVTHLNGHRAHDRRWADRAYWPALRSGHRDLDARRPGHHRERNALASGYASLLANNCGRAIVKQSRWIVTAPGDPRAHPALSRNYFLLRRSGHWLVWFTTP